MTTAESPLTRPLRVQRSEANSGFSAGRRAGAWRAVHHVPMDRVSPLARSMSAYAGRVAGVASIGNVFDLTKTL